MKITDFISRGRLSVLFCAMIILAMDVHAQEESRAPKYSNSFLNIGAGARNLAMGGAVVANVADATAGYWNPARLSGAIQKTEIALMHSEYFTGLANYDYGAIAHAVDAENTIGFSFVRLGVDDIPNTLNLVDPNGNVDYSRVERFSSADYGFILSYSRAELENGVKLGANVKVVRRVIGKFANAWGFGFDLGASRDFGKWTAGLALRDVTNTFNFWDFNTELLEQAFTETGNLIPENSLELTRPSLSAGLSRPFALGEKFNVLAEGDLDLFFDGQRNALISSRAFSGDLKLGAEFSYVQKFFFRMGLNNFQRSTDLDGNRQYSIQPNLGAGVRIKNIVIDYAITDLGSSDNSFYSNVISLLIQFRD